MRVDDESVLSMCLVRPVAQRCLHRTADLGLARAVGAERHHWLFQPPQDHVPHEVLSVFLRRVDDVVAFTSHTGMTGEVLDIREQAAPLGLEQVDNVQVLRLRFKMAALRGEEVNVRVAGVPSTLVHVDPAFQAQLKLLLSRSDLDLGTERLVFVATRGINDHLASWQPALCRPIDVGITNLTKPRVAADVDVPSVEVGVDLVVVAVWLVRHTVRRPEVDATRHDFPGLVVNYLDLHPVLTRFGKCNAHFFGLDRTLALNLSPCDAIDILAALRNIDRRRWYSRQLDVGRARFGVLRLAETFVRVVQEIVDRLLR